MMDQDELRALTNRAGELHRRGAPSREIIALLEPAAQSFPRATTANGLRAMAWLDLSKQEGPSAEAERWIRHAFERGIEAPGEGDAPLVNVVTPLRLLEEYLLREGRLDEADEAGSSPRWGSPCSRPSSPSS